jgi:RNA polymerase sigma-70 factor (ECF subfamily)
MFRIIQNLYRDQTRAAAVRRRHQSESGALSQTSTDGTANMEARAALGTVQAGLCALPDEQRVVLLMVCVEGLSYRETAESLGVPVGTVMSRLARGRQRLHEILLGNEVYAGKSDAEVVR